MARALEDATTRPLAGPLARPLAGALPPLVPPPETVAAAGARRPDAVMSLIQLALVGAVIAIVATLLVLYLR